MLEIEVRKGPEDTKDNKIELRCSNALFYLIESCFKNMINYIHSYMLYIQVHIQNIHNSKHPSVTFYGW